MGFEPLETRALLSGAALAELDAYGQINQPGDTAEIGLQIRKISSGAAQPITLALRSTAAPQSDFDPAGAILRRAGQVVPRTWARADVGGTPDSLIHAKVRPGYYTVTVRGQSSSTGDFGFEVFVPGDLNGNGRVSIGEWRWAQGALQQALGRVDRRSRIGGDRAEYGLDFSRNLYRKAIDANANGVVDQFDVRVIAKNYLARTRLGAKFIAEFDAPVTEAGLVTDTGVRGDGITKDLAVRLHVTDASPIKSIVASIDGGPFTEQLATAQQNQAREIEWTLSQAQLETIANGPLGNNGPHVLQVIASDRYGNRNTPAIDLAFELDTIAPPAPTAPDLVAPSDTGASDSDNVTRDNTPSFEIHAEANSHVRLYSGLHGFVGKGTASSAVTITSSPLSDGRQKMQAKAVDAAGNVSRPSAPLWFTIDRQTPAPPRFILSPDADTGVVGDHFTELRTVSFRGVAEPLATVSWQDTASSTVARGNGFFLLEDVNLLFGEHDYTLIVTDAAGNSAQSTRSFTRNDIPQLDDQTLSISLTSGPGDRVGTVVVQDEDVPADGDRLNFQVIGGTGVGLFSVDVPSGQITVAENAQLDFETNGGRYDLTIRVEDSMGGSDTGTVTIIGGNQPPELPQIAAQDVRGGSPLHIPLNGFDADGDTLTYTVTVNHGSDVVQATLPETGSRAMQVNVQDFGTMLFRLFDNRVPDVTDTIAGFVNANIYDGLQYWRVIDDFMFQSEGADVAPYDDGFHLDLQHNTPGLLSLANAGKNDDNGASYFVTDVPTRHLDFDHSIFGILVEGEDVRQAIISAPVEPNPDRNYERSLPSTPVVITSQEIVVDTQNEVLMIKALHGVTGTAQITVTVSDGTLEVSRTFDVNVIEDLQDDGFGNLVEVNSNPIVGPILDMQGNEITQFTTPVGTQLQFWITAQDVEGDPAVLLTDRSTTPPGGTFVTDINTGLVTFTAPGSITGDEQLFEFGVGVGQVFSKLDTQVFQILVTRD